MKQYIEDRTMREAEILTSQKLTVRAVAKIVGVSKSTVYKDISERLQDLNYGLYMECQDVLNHNAAVRHIRGGEATKKRFETHPPFWVRKHTTWR